MDKMAAEYSVITWSVGKWGRHSLHYASISEQIYRETRRRQQNVAAQNRDGNWYQKAAKTVLTIFALNIKALEKHLCN